MNRTQARGRPGQRGFTIVEILVALFVLSVGLLGLASLQVIGVKNSGSAYHRTQATLIANELIEKMRANKVAAREGRYDVTVNDVDAVNCEGASPGGLVNAQLFHTICAVKGSLPRGSLTVTCLQGCREAPPTTAPLKYRVSVGWQEVERDYTLAKDAASSPIAKEISLEVIL